MERWFSRFVFCFVHMGAVYSLLGHHLLSQDVGAELLLTEERVIDIPLEFPLTAVTISDDGSALYWSGSARTVILHTAESVTILCPGALEEPVAAAFDPLDLLQIEIVDAGRSAIVTVSADGGCDHRTDLSGIGRLVGGARTGVGWVLARLDSLGVPTIVGLDSAGHLLWTKTSDGDLGNPLTVRSAHIIAWESGTVLSSMVWPFRWLSLDRQGKAIVTGAFEQVRALEERRSLAEWVGLPVLPIDSGYVQTLADPRSDARVLVLYKPDGALRRQRQLLGPIGLVASNILSRRVVALRRSDRLELIMYQWRWQN